MKALLLELVSSKKFLVAMISVGVWVAGRWGFHANPDDVLKTVAPLWAYIVGQGIADTGKSAMLIQAGQSAASGKAQ